LNLILNLFILELYKVPGTAGTVQKRQPRRTPRGQRNER